MIEIREYITPDGSSPFREWLLNLRDRKAKAKILTRLDRVAAGNLGDHKYLRDGVCVLPTVKVSVFIMEKKLTPLFCYYVVVISQLKAEILKKLLNIGRNIQVNNDGKSSLQSK
jgi:hypothetical protein